MRLALEKLGVRPIVDLGMRLGEGTGAALAMSVVESALALFHADGDVRECRSVEKIAEKCG